MTNASTLPSTGDHPTARGDRAGRRRDVLAAASEILEESGWEGFSIREIASRAGVSTGAVYQWFSGKDEIFRELFNGEVRAGLELLDTIPDDLDLSLNSTVRMMLDWVVGLYDKLGRYELEFIATRGGHSSGEVAPTMEATYIDLVRQADALLDRAAAVDDLTLVEASDDRITWIWAGCVGAAERLIVSPNRFAGERRAEFLDFAAERLTRSLVAQ